MGHPTFRVRKKMCQGGKKDSRCKILFKPLHIKGLELRNRLIYPSVVTGYGSKGYVSQRSLDFYGERADHGVSLIIVEPGKVDKTNMSFMNLGIYDDSFLPGLTQLVKRIHRRGALAGIQLHHTGRQGHGIPLIAPSPIAWSPREETPREMTHEDIRQMVRNFAQAAHRAKQAGFDIVEIHGAHGYLIGEFLSPLSNRRADKYGGILNNRTRFALEVVSAIREEVGPDMPLSFRINGSDNIPGGFAIEDAKMAAGMLVEAGVDMLSVSSGVYGSYPTIIPPFDMPPGCNVPLAEEIKKAVDVPVVVAGRLDDLQLAESIIKSGKADLVALGRSLLADPELPEKAARGEMEDIRPCLACCRCLDAGYEHGGVVCTINPAVGRESEFSLARTENPRKVLIVGGGLAGLEAARVASQRGHQVTLYEQASELGGQWLFASIPPGKQDFGKCITWLERQLKKSGVRVRTGTCATPELIDDEKPDVVILATGAKPVSSTLSGFPPEKIFTSWDILRSQPVPGQQVLVIGGNALGLEVADYLSFHGCKVIVAEKLPHIGREMVNTVRFHLINRLMRQGVELMRSVEVLGATDKNVMARKGDTDLPLGDFDIIVMAIGAQSRCELVDSLKNTAKEVYVIGDASQPRQAADAVREGAEIGLRI